MVTLFGRKNIKK